MTDSDTALESSQDGRFVYRYAQPSLGASATVVFRDKDAGGELKMLMIRRKRDEDYWTYPSGYVELITEETGGKLAGGQAASSMPSPQEVIDAHFPQLLQQKGWQIADSVYNNGLRATLAGYGVECPVDKDVSQLETMIREVKEETGIDLAQYPDAKIDFVRSELSFWYSSGNQRSYTVNPHYLVDLGQHSAAELKLRFEGEAKEEKEEIKEMAWVPVRNIVRQNGIYKVGGKARDVKPYAVPAIELSMHKWLSNQIEVKTGKRMSTPVNVQASLRDVQFPIGMSGLGGADELSIALETVRKTELSEQGMMESLLGQDGMLRLNSFIKVASHLIAARRVATRACDQLATV